MLRHPVRVKGASRTDTGVHAERQVAIFSSPLQQERRWLRSINAILPSGISVLSIDKVPPTFHPCYQAKAKAYRYRIHAGTLHNPFLSDYVWDIYFPIDIDLLEQALFRYIGRHDFSAFCNQGAYTKSNVRTLLDAKIDRSGNLIDLWFLGEGFLKQMVRILVGTSVEVASGKRQLQEIDLLLKEGDRTKAGATAPAKGLSLVEIFYDEILTIDQVIAKARSGYCLAL